MPKDLAVSRSSRAKRGNKSMSKALSAAVMVLSIYRRDAGRRA